MKQCMVIQIVTPYIVSFIILIDLKALALKTKKNLCDWFSCSHYNPRSTLLYMYEFNRGLLQYYFAFFSETLAILKCILRTLLSVSAITTLSTLALFLAIIIHVLYTSLTSIKWDIGMRCWIPFPRFVHMSRTTLVG